MPKKWKVRTSVKFLLLTKTTRETAEILETAYNEAPYGKDQVLKIVVPASKKVNCSLQTNLTQSNLRFQQRMKNERICELIL